MLHIVGTSHHYQFGAGARFGKSTCSEADQAAFSGMLRQLVTAVGAEVLAEEMSTSALAEVGKTTSVMELLSTVLNLEHVFCDPDRSERPGLGIFEDNQIRLSAFPKTLDESVVQERIADSWQRREQEWLRRLSAFSSKTIIFVCGADHIPTFVPLARSEGYVCAVAHADWEA